MFNLALIIFVFISPILLLPLSVPALGALQWYQWGMLTNNPQIIQLQIFLYGIILLVIASLFDKPKRLFGDDYIRWILLIYFLNVYAHPLSIKTFPTVFLGFILYYLVSTMAIVNKRNLRLIFYVIALVSLINTFFATLQSFHIKFLFFKEGEIIGLMQYKTQLGIYQALALPICFSLNPCLIIIPMIGLLLSNSATAMSAGVMGMIYFLWKKGLKIKSVPIWQVIFIVSGIYLYGHFNKLDIRFEAWKYVIQDIMKRPFEGNGVGLFHYTWNNPITSIYGTQDWPITYTDPYSVYLEVFHALGIFGFIFFIIFLFDKFINVARVTHETQALFTSCLILAIFGIGYSFMDYPRLAGTAIVLFGLLTAVKKDGEKCL